MFTGIVEKTVNVVGVADGPKFRRLTIALDWADVNPGDSVAVNGCCLTVAQIDPGRAPSAPVELGFDVIQETLDKTNLGRLRGGDEVHVERSLRVGDRFDGHFVQGHIDGTGPLIKRVEDEKEWRLTIEAPVGLAKYLTPKGSISVDGVSLTIAAVHGNLFEVALIPTTLRLTTLGRRALGWPFNLEADVISKTIVAFMEQRLG